MSKVIAFDRTKEYPFTNEEEKRIHDEMSAIIASDEILEKLNEVTDEDIDKAYGNVTAEINPEDLVAYL